MEWDPTERDAWVPDAQRWISRITGVLQCKIDLDDSGEITGIHVVAGMDRDPRHIVRDVEGLLKARLDVDVYYKKIGVVQVLDNISNGESKSAVSEAPEVSETETGAAAQSVPGSSVTFFPPQSDLSEPMNPAPDTVARQTAQKPVAPPIPAILVAEDLAVRMVCIGVGVMAAETTIRAEVRLRLGEIEAEGIREGANHSDSDIRLLAEAALAAVTELIADPVLLHLREVRLQEVGGQTVILTAVDLVEGRQSQTLFGTCSTSHNRQQAVVYSVLDALNRRLAMHGLKSLAENG